MGTSFPWTAKHFSISLASTSPISTVLGVVHEGGVVERESEEVEFEREDSNVGGLDGVRGREDDEAPKLCLCSLPSLDSISGK